MGGVWAIDAGNGPASSTGLIAEPSSSGLSSPNGKLSSRSDIGGSVGIVSALGLLSGDSDGEFEPWSDQVRKRLRRRGIDEATEAAVEQVSLRQHSIWLAETNEGRWYSKFVVQSYPHITAFPNSARLAQRRKPPTRPNQQMMRTGGGDGLVLNHMNSPSWILLYFAARSYTTKPLTTTFYIVALGLTLVPTPLIKPRYFLVPYVLLRLLVGPVVEEAGTWPVRLLVEGCVYGLVNVVTIAVFL